MTAVPVRRLDLGRPRGQDVGVRSPLALTAVVALLMVLVAGCSDDEAPSTAGDTPSESVSPTPPPETPSESSGLGGVPAPSVTPTATPAPTVTPAPTPSPEATPEPDLDAPPRTYDEALALFDRAAGSQELSRFASPSGNLYCVLDSPYLPPSCELAAGSIPDPASCPDGGPTQNVGRIEFTEAAPQPICNTDTIREPGPPTLGYGGIATWPDTTVTCLMEKFGVTCVNEPAGQGFFLAKGRYQIFG